MDDKLAEFQGEVRLREEEAAPKVLKKACYDKQLCVVQHSSRELSLSFAACADFMAL